MPDERNRKRKPFILFIITLLVAFAALGIADEALNLSGGNNTINITNITSFNNFSNFYNSTNLTVGVNSSVCLSSPEQYSRYIGNNASGYANFICVNDNSGTSGVTSISQGTGIILTPNPIVATGTVDLNISYVNDTLDSRYRKLTNNNFTDIDVSGNVVVAGSLIFNSTSCTIFNNNPFIQEFFCTPKNIGFQETYNNDAYWVYANGLGRRINIGIRNNSNTSQMSESIYTVDDVSTNTSHFYVNGRLISGHDDRIISLENNDTSIFLQLFDKVNTPFLDHNGTSGQYLITNGDGTTSWTTLPPAGSVITYFLHNETATGLSYTSKEMNRTLDLNDPLAITNRTALPTGITLIQNWTSSGLNISLIPAGVHTVHIHAMKTGGGGAKVVKLYWNCSIVNNTGGNMSFHGTSEISQEVLSTITEIDMDMLMPDINVNVSDRELIQVYAIETGGGALPELSLQYDDLTDSRLILPSMEIDINPLINNITILQNKVSTIQSNETEYFLTNGSRNMTGNLNVGNHDIYNVTDVTANRILTNNLTASNTLNHVGYGTHFTTDDTKYPCFEDLTAGRFTMTSEDCNVKFFMDDVPSTSYKWGVTVNNPVMNSFSEVNNVGDLTYIQTSSTGTDRFTQIETGSTDSHMITSQASTGDNAELRVNYNSIETYINGNFMTSVSSLGFQDSTLSGFDKAFVCTDASGFHFRNASPCNPVIIYNQSYHNSIIALQNNDTYANNSFALLNGSNNFTNYNRFNGQIETSPTIFGTTIGNESGYSTIEMASSKGGFIDFTSGNGTDRLARIIYLLSSSTLSFQVVGGHFSFTGLPASAQTSALCYNSITGEVTYNSGFTTCAQINEWTYLTLPDNYTMNSASVYDVNVSGVYLNFTPVANTKYEFEGKIMVATALATVNPRIGLAWPTGLNFGAATIYEPQTATTQLIATDGYPTNLLTAAGGLSKINSPYLATIQGELITGSSTSGVVKIQLASETAGTNVQMLNGSFLKYRTI